MSVLDEQNIVKAKGGLFSCIPARYVLCAMCFTAVAIDYVNETTLSEMIVAMVRHPSSESKKLRRLERIQMGMRNNLTLEQLDICPGKLTDDADYQNGEFDWDEELQGYVLSAYYYGYVTTQLLGGRLSDMFGAKIVLGPGVLLASVMTVLSPLAARGHVAAFIAVRVLIGAGSGVIQPSMHSMFSKWYPAQERTIFASIVMGAVPLGTVIGLSVSGFLAKLLDWSYVFYIFGGISVLWYVPWLLLVYNTPDQHPRISEQEKKHIVNSLGEQEHGQVALPVPWLAMLTSIPLWAHICMATGYGWIESTVLTELPSYLTNMLNFDLEQSGIDSALPFAFSFFSGMVFGFLSQWLRAKGYISHLTAYRIFNTICGVGVATFLFVITLVGCDSTFIVVLLVLTLVSLSGFLGGSLMNTLDLCSNFAGTATGITHTFVSIAGIFSPMAVGNLTNNRETLTQWHIVFYIAIGIILVAYIVFMLFGSVEEQLWNRPPLEENRTEEETENTSTKQEEV